MVELILNKYIFQYFGVFKLLHYHEEHYILEQSFCIPQETLQRKCFASERKSITIQWFYHYASLGVP